MYAMGPPLTVAVSTRSGLHHNDEDDHPSSEAQHYSNHGHGDEVDKTDTSEVQVHLRFLQHMLRPQISPVHRGWQNPG